MMLFCRIVLDEVVERGFGLGVLFIQPYWPRDNELWLHRQIAELRDDLAGMLVRKALAADWNGTPAYDYQFQRSRWPRWAPLGITQRIHRRRVYRQLRDPAVSCILINYASTAVDLFEELKQVDKPKFVYCHGADVMWHKKDWKGRGLTPIHSPEYPDRVRALAEHGFRFIANSTFTKHLLESVGIAEDEIVVRYFGIPRESSTGERTSSHESSGRPIQILYLGRLIDFKGPDATILAFERACNMGLDAELVIAGEGWLKPTCELLRYRSTVRERVHLIGSVSETQGQELRAKADIFTAHTCNGILSESTEAFGVAFGEAMGAALPVVTGAAGGVTDYLEHESNALLFEPENIEQHAEMLVRVGKDQALGARLGAEGWATAGRLFDPKIQRELLLRILYGQDEF